MNTTAVNLKILQFENSPSFQVMSFEEMKFSFSNCLLKQSLAKVMSLVTKL